MNCKNCQLPLPETGNYCLRCGGKVIRNKLTLKNLFAHFSEQFLNYDNKFIQTFKALFLRPEEVIDGYIHGLRKRYVNPISYFAIALTLAGLYIYITQKYFPEALNISNMSAKGQEEFSKQWLDFFLENQSLMTFINIPIYAFIGWLTFKTLKRYNFVSHIVVFLYTTPQVSFALFLPQFILMFFGLTLGDFSLPLLAIQMIYIGYVYQRIFKLTSHGFILRCAWFLVILFVFFVIATIVTVAYMMMTGTMQELIEAQKAAKKSTYLLSNFLTHKLHFV